MKKTDFNQGWLFWKEDGEEKEFQRVDLPHDAMIHENRDPNCRNGKTTGYFPGGKYRYEKHFHAPEEWNGQSVFAEFEGVYQNVTVFLNGEKLYWQPNGYTGFLLELSGKLLPEKENVLTVVADNSGEPNTRWYSGSGIYRPVWIYTGHPCHIEADGVEVTTVSLHPVKIRVRTRTTGGEVNLKIFRDGEMVAEAKGADTVLEIPDACLWEEKTPQLYTCQASLYEKGELTDQAEVFFGICKLRWGTEGLFVNGTETKLRGACIHQDNGILGAAEFPEAARRRIRIMKEAGFNAVRCAHHPCSKALLQACDELGMYVMDEFSDMWYEHKNRYDYASWFEEWYRRDLETMVRKDISHPSVIFYSIGNEVTETAEPSGIRYTKEMTELVHTLDPTRPVTCGINMALNVMHFVGMGVYQPAEGEKVRPKEPKNPRALAMLGQMKQAMGGQAAGQEQAVGQEQAAGQEQKANQDQAGSMDSGSAGEAALGMTAEMGAKRDGKLVGSEYFNQMMVVMKERQQEIVKQDIAKILSEDAYEALDVAGYNYAVDRYGLDKQEYPNRVSVGTETLPQKIYDNWQAVMASPASLGDFIWTGWDYLGEAGVGAFCYDSVGTKEKEYPFLLAGSGIIDILGNLRPEVWLNKAVYGCGAQPKIGVEPVNHAGENHIISAWRYSDAVHSWSWEGFEGYPAKIVVYSSGKEVELLRDGVSLGRAATEKYQAHFETLYQPGELKAIAYDENGGRIGEDVMRTAKGHTMIQAEPEKTELKADGQDLCYVNLALVGENKVVKSTADQELTVSVEGAGVLAGFGNANPCTEESYTDHRHTTYYGRAQLAVRTTTEPGEIRIRIEGAGLEPATVRVWVE